MRSKRKMIVVLLGAALLCTTATREAQAKPSFGSNCLSCHDYDGNIMEVTGHDEVVSLSSRLDGGTSAGLRTFVVTAGQSIALKVNVLYGNSKYSVSLRHLDGGGVEQSGSNRLVFTPDSGWRDRGDYYTTSVTSWNGSATAHTFNLAVDAATPADFYALETITGRKGGGEWAQDEEFYLQVVASNAAPTVAITDPLDGDVFTGAPASIVITAEAFDSDGTVAKVEFFEGATKLGQAANIPYSFEWVNPPVGDYTLTATATDDGGMTSTSSPVNITVGGVSDDDADGVPNDLDACPGTASCAIVDATGCAGDDDSDGVVNGCDQCPGQDDVDSDGDGIYDCVDNCPSNANPGQADFDADGMGDACDADAPGDGDDDEEDDVDEDDAEDDADGEDEGDDHDDDECEEDQGDEDDDGDDDTDDYEGAVPDKSTGGSNGSAGSPSSPMCGSGISLAAMLSFFGMLTLRLTGRRSRV